MQEVSGGEGRSVQDTARIHALPAQGSRVSVTLASIGMTYVALAFAASQILHPMGDGTREQREVALFLGACWPLTLFVVTLMSCWGIGGWLSKVVSSRARIALAGCRRLGGWLMIGASSRASSRTSSVVDLARCAVVRRRTSAQKGTVDGTQ